MKRINQLYFCASIMVVGLLMGCATKAVGPNLAAISPEQRKGLLIVNFTPHKTIGAIVDMPQPSVIELSTTNMRQGIQPMIWGKVFNEQNIAQAIKQQTLYTEGTEQAMNLAKTLNASYVVVGEAEVTTGKSVGGAIAQGITSGLFGAASGKQTAGAPIPHYVSGAKFTYQAYTDNTATFDGEATLQITYNVIEVDSGQTVYKGKANGTAKARFDKMPEEFARPMSVIKSYEPAKSLWMVAATEAGKKAAADLPQNWPYIYRPKGTVQQIHSNEIVVSLGKLSGMTKGTMLAVFNTDDTNYQNPLAFFEVSQPQDNSCVAKLEKGFSINDIQTGMVVIPCQKELFEAEE